MDKPRGTKNTKGYQAKENVKENCKGTAAQLASGQEALGSGKDDLQSNTPVFFPPLKRAGQPFDISKCKPKIPKFQFDLPDILEKPISGVCTYCGQCQSRTQKCFFSASVYTHLVTGECNFLKKNFPPSHQFECEICDLKVNNDQKTKNIAILDHLKNYHSDLKQICIYCDSLVPIANFSTHLWNESNSVFEEGIGCKKCFETFYSVNYYYDHLSRHDAGAANVSTFKRCVPDSVTKYHLAILGLLVYKQLARQH